jgi:hypothetical protein
LLTRLPAFPFAPHHSIQASPLTLGNDGSETDGQQEENQEVEKQDTV